MLGSVDELLGIGGFSRRCGLSAKVLRSYAAVGLLTPAAVDPNTGYRYYAAGQLHRARVIGLLRRAGVPVADIGDFLDSPTLAQLDIWERTLEVETSTRRRALAEARGQLGLDVQAANPTPETTLECGGNEMATMTSGHATDQGPVRALNQDAVRIGPSLYAVADGFGNGGELAAGVALEALDATFSTDQSADGLLEGCREANRAVWRRASTDRSLRGMGTTLTAVGVSCDRQVVAVSVGDSRLYRLRAGELDQLTEDDSVVAELVRQGELTEDQARSHPRRAVLTKALGMGPAVEPVLVGMPCVSGDRLVLCTDGLFNECSEAELASVLDSQPDPQGAASELVRLAVHNGGSDNASVVVIDVG